MHERAFWEEINIPSDELYKRLQECVITVQAINYSGNLKPFQDAFAANGMKLAESGELEIIITDNYESPELEKYNQAALQTGKHWMLVKPTGAVIWIGPVFIPGKTGCWKCLEQRVSLNHGIQNFFLTAVSGKKAEMFRPATPASLQICANMVALEAAKYLYKRDDDNLAGYILSLDAGTMSMQKHVLVKRPQCRACGDLSGIQALKQKTIQLDRQNTLPLSTDGGFRTLPPEETIRRYQRHVSPITGVVQTLEQIPEQVSSPVYNYYSGANMALRSKSLYWLNNHARSFSGGKGRNHAQAKAGALCEAIERYSCSYHGEEETFAAAYTEIKERAIHPYQCLNFSEKQYQMREQLNAQCTKYYFLIPEKFSEHEPVDWVKVYQLGTDTYKYIPANYTYYQYPVSELARQFCFPDSNGNAAGNTLEEAVLQGLLELVERDSVAIWWYNRINRPHVDIRSFHDDYFDRLISYYDSIGRSLYVIDLVFDLKIPCFAALSFDKSGKLPLMGFGAHTDTKIAMERALIELNQFLPMLNDSRYKQDKSISDWLDSATRENQPYLLPDPDQGKTYNCYEINGEPDIQGAIQYCQNRLLERGLETYYLDMTQPDIGLPVAKVIVPGLRHFWKRLGPGRLYDVPVSLGLLPERKREVDMNPISIFF
jgi:ribosomal protein S12 methylthiotransferase accessory factor